MLTVAALALSDAGSLAAQSDFTGPTVHFHPASGTRFTNPSPTIRVSGCDMGSDVTEATILLGGVEAPNTPQGAASDACTTNYSQGFAAPLTLQLGSNSVVATVCDAAGNCTMRSATYHLDPAPPPTTPLPGVSLAIHQDSLLDPALCVADCFDAVTGYATPAYVSRDVPRSLALSYRSQHAAPKGYVRFDLIDTASTAADYYSLRLRRSDGTFVPLLNTGGTTELVIADPLRAVGVPYRVALAFDASALATGRHTYTLLVTAVRGGGQVQGSTPVGVLIVNQRASQFGSGWSLAGLQTITELVNGERLLVEGTGRVIRFGPQGCTGCNFVSPAGEFTTLVRHATTGVYTRTYPDGSTATFSSAGRLTRLTDRFAQVTTFTWSGTTLTGVTDPAGRTISISAKDANGRYTLTDPAGRVSRVQLDASHRVTSIQNPALHTTTYAYNPDHTLRDVTDARGGLWSYAYDALGRLASATAPQITAEGVLRRPVTTVRSIERAEGEVPAGTGTVSTPLPRRDPAALRAEVTNARGATVRYAVDRFGAPLRIEAPLGRTTVLERNAAGQVTRVTDPAGDQTTSTWWGARLREQVNVATGQTVTYDYVGTTPLVRKVSGDVIPQWTSYVNGRLATVWVGDSIGAGERHFAQADGRDTLVVDPRGYVTKFRYLLTGSQNLEWTIAAGDTTRYWYDAAGRPDSVRNARGLVTRFAYDTLNRTTRVTGPVGDVTQYTYDARYLTQVQDALGQTYTFRPNALGWVEREVQPRGDSLRAVFDVGGNVTQQVNRRGQAIQYTYNLLGELETRVADGQTSRFQVDPLTRTVRDSNAVSRSETVWDPAARALTRKTWLLGREYHVTEQFDRRGLLTERKIQEAGYWEVWRTKYHYGAKGLLDSLTDIAGKTTTFTYNAERQRVSTVLPFSGAPVTIGQSIAERDQPTWVTYTDPTLDAALGQAINVGTLGLTAEVLRGDRMGGREFHYDSLLRLARVRDFTTPAPCAADSLNALFEGPLYGDPARWDCQQQPKTYGADQRWAYDLVGNRRQSGDSVAWGNRVMRPDSSFALTYDADGNVLSKGAIQNGRAAQTFTWNALGQLTRLIEGAAVVDFAYDANGTRVRRTEGGIAKGFLYAGDALVAELATDGSVLKLFSHYPEGVDQPHSMYRASRSHYYATDHRGSVSAVLSDSGVLLQQYAYEPFGRHLIEPDTIYNPLRYNARELERVGGLVNMRARWYDPELERFLSEDPIGIEGGINLYAFAANDPVNHADPYGLEPKCVDKDGKEIKPTVKSSETNKEACKRGGGTWLPGLPPVVTTAAAGSSSAGVWLGAWKIRTSFGTGLLGARHTAISIVEPSGRTTTYELVGWPNSVTNERSARSSPHYASKSDYAWVKIAGPHMIDDFRRQIDLSWKKFEGTWYVPGDSNRYTSDVLGRLAFGLTPTQRQFLGWMPGF